MDEKASYKEKLEVLKQQEELIEDEAEQEQVDMFQLVSLFVLTHFCRKKRRLVVCRRRPRRKQGEKRRHSFGICFPSPRLALTRTCRCDVLISTTCSWQSFHPSTKLLLLRPPPRLTPG